MDMHIFMNTFGKWSIQRRQRNAVRTTTAKWVRGQWWSSISWLMDTHTAKLRAGCSSWRRRIRTRWWCGQTNPHPRRAHSSSSPTAAESLHSVSLRGSAAVSSSQQTARRPPARVDRRRRRRSARPASRRPYRQLYKLAFRRRRQFMAKTSSLYGRL